MVEGHDLPKGGKLFALQTGDEGGQRGVQGTDALSVVEPVIEEALNHLSGLILVDFHDDPAYGLSSAARPNRIRVPTPSYTTIRGREQGVLERRETSGIVLNS